MSATWAEERTKILEEIKKLNPSDRFAFYTALIRLNSALYESVRGWDSWLKNPAFMETFNEDELKEIFKEFKAICVRFLEEDVKWTGKKERAQFKAPRAERPEAERRYV